MVKPTHISRLATLLDQAKASEVADYTRALSAALKTLAPAEQYTTVQKIISGASNKARFYPVLALSGTDEAVNDLIAAAREGSAEAVKALGKTGNYKAAPALLDAARKGNADALKDYIRFVDNFEKDVDRKCDAFANALAISQDPAVQSNVLAKLANTPTAKAFAVAGSYIDKPEIAIPAAEAAKKIAAKCVDDLDAGTKKDILNKAIQAFQARGMADDGYAVDEIKKMLSEMKDASPIFTLSDEEKKAGFEMLFDGSNLDKWTGNKDGYRITNNEIYVTAGYGNGGNLYTEKQYRDFVFRFEFSFVRPGANNGVGVRTPHGVDAAYDGMCERPSASPTSRWASGTARKSASRVTTSRLRSTAKSFSTAISARPARDTTSPLTAARSTPTPSTTATIPACSTRPDTSDSWVTARVSSSGMSGFWTSPLSRKQKEDSFF